MSTATAEKSNKTNKKMAFQLKGSLFTLTVLHLLSADTAAFEKQLQDTIAKAPKFFEHAPIVIDLNEFPAETAELELAAITQCLRSQGLIPVGIRGGNPVANKQATTVGLAILANSTSTQITTNNNNAPETNSEAKQKYTASKPDTNANSDITEPKAKQTQTSTTQAAANPTKVITQPVRSGQQIYAKGCDLIILSTVSHGAEVLADGHIHIYGALRGRALAGILGNTQARIFCNSMEAELISIAGRYLVSEQLSDFNNLHGLHIFLEGDQLQITTI